MSAAETKDLVKGWRAIAAWGLVLLAGLAAWLVLLAAADPRRAWLAFLVAFVFFVPLAAGLVVWSAIVHASKGRWAGTLEGVTRTGLPFALPSLLALGGLWIGGGAWAPWMEEKVEPALWFEPVFLFGRDLFALAVFWALGILYVLRRARGGGSVIGPILIVVYCFAFSLLGFDLVMVLGPHWRSSLFGGYFFISGLYIAVAAWALAAVFRPDGTEGRRHDLGKLLFAFCLLTTYMGFAQFLPIWYENIPEETAFFVPRVNFLPWSGVSVALLAVIYLGPILFLLPAFAKRSRAWLAAASVVILLGMWVERWWLVYGWFFPGRLEFGLVEVAATALFLGALALAALLGGRWVPVIPSGGGDR